MVERTVTRIHLDAVGGIAGDMFAAALLDCFPDLVPRVMTDLDAVHPGDGSAVSLTEGTVSGLRALRFGVTSPSSPPGAHANERHTHRQDHAHADGPAAAAGAEDRRERQAAHEGHHGSSFAGIRAHIEAAPLAPGTRDHALAILSILAHAEARMHALAVEDVHFHEVGDWDSILDVVAAGSITAALPDVSWTVSSLPLGSGLVRTAHGLLPVPAPATAAILTDFAWRDDGVAGERVTPTGAAILRHLCEPKYKPDNEVGQLLATGTGAGTRTLERVPNILRALAFDKGEHNRTEDVVVLAFDVDDMTGEEIATAADRLRQADGVCDLTLCNTLGKKSRPAVRFELLVQPATLAAVSHACFAETSTIGLRWAMQRRHVLDRRASRQSDMRVKMVTRPGVGTTAKAEQDDLRELPTLEKRRQAGRIATQPMERIDDD